MSRASAASRPPLDGPARFGDMLDRIASAFSRWRLWLLVLVALAQAGVLTSMVVGRERLIASARVIDLDVIPVDPRSLFRGDYVILSYGISRIANAPHLADLKRGDHVYVELSKATGTWLPVATTRAMPNVRAAGNVVLAGRVRYAPARADAGGTLSVAYGIESFFVPEGEGRVIERDVGQRKVIAHIAVGADGTAAIRALSVDGKRLEIEPLF